MLEAGTRAEKLAAADALTRAAGAAERAFYFRGAAAPRERR